MSAIKVWCELVCFTCSEAAPGRWVTGQIPKRRMVLEAKQRGWLVQDGKMFCDEDCLFSHNHKKEVAAAENVEHNSEHGQG